MGVLHAGRRAGYSAGRQFSFWAALVIVPLLLAAVGAVFGYVPADRCRSAPHGRGAGHLRLALIIGPAGAQDLGVRPLSVEPPPVLAGSVDLLGTLYPSYRLFLVAVGFGTCLALAGWLKFTTSGMHARREPAAARGADDGRQHRPLACWWCAWASPSPAGRRAGRPVPLGGPRMDQLPDRWWSSAAWASAALSPRGGLGFIQVIGTVLFPSLAVLAPSPALFGGLRGGHGFGRLFVDGGRCGHGRLRPCRPGVGGCPGVPDRGRWPEYSCRAVLSNGFYLGLLINGCCWASRPVGIGPDAPVRPGDVRRGGVHRACRPTCARHLRPISGTAWPPPCCRCC